MGHKFEGKQAWVALVASTLSYILMCIPDSTFGILYDHVVAMYDTSRTGVGWTLSIYWICIYVAGLLFSPMIDLYGCRTLAFLSAVLYGVGISLSSTAFDLLGLYLAYGVLGGLGCGGLYLASSTIIQQLFIYNRGFASGMSSLGFSIGGIIHPLYTLHLLHAFDVRGTFLIQGGIVLHAALFSLALKSPESSSTTDQKRSTASDRPSRSDDRLKVREACGCDSSERMITKSLITEAGSQTVTGPEAIEGAQDSLAVGSGSGLDDGNAVQSVGPGDKKNGEVDLSTSRRRPQWYNKSLHHVKAYFRRMLDFSLLRNVVFVLATLHFFLLWMARLSIVAQLVSCAVHRGTSEQNAAYLITISGFSNLAMRIIASVLMNFSWMDPVLFSGLAATVAVVAGLLAAYSQSYLMFIITASLMGMSEGIAMANLPLLIVHIVGIARFPRGIALFWTLMIPAPLGAAPFSGWLVDKSGDYVIAFLVIGCEAVASLVLAGVVYILNRRQRPRDAEAMTAEVKC